jgi:acyl-CoA thioester hydrolase
MKEAFSIRFKVPFGDVDMMGHVNNAKYLTYFETARTDYLRAQFGVGVLAEGDRSESVIIARAEVDYKSPATWNDELVVKVRPSSIGTSSWVYDYEIVNEKTGALIALGKTVQVSYDYLRKTKLPVPDRLRQQLLKDMESTRE